jgi:multidrug efflux pump subunit AcrB
VAGATTDDVANEVTHPLEVRLSAIDGVRRVTSTSRDEVSAVQVEFEYEVGINIAANAVTTELSRVTGLLPPASKRPWCSRLPMPRARPILMTALSSAVGMMPLALEWAVGIERLSPLAVVAIGGLLAGTFLTLLAVPVMFSVLHGLREKLFRRIEA